jgi:tetratricopeptide (TPR) repeat protein
MNWLEQLLRPKPLSQEDRDFFDACKAFSTAKQIWQDAVKIKGEGWRERQLSKIEEALKYFDQAIKKGLVEQSVFHHGFDAAEAFSLRGSCLNDLGFYFEALEDYNEAIKRKPRKGIAHNYPMRSMIKDLLFDLEGSLADLKEALLLSQLRNDDNTYWNKYAQSTGFHSQTAFYEMSLPTEEEVAWKKGAYSHEDVVQRLRNIKRKEL